MKRLVLFFLASIALSLSAPSAPETEEMYHRVKKTDKGFIQVARIYEVDWKEMARLNNRQPPHYRIYVGEKLRIPSRKKISRLGSSGSSPWRWRRPGQYQFFGGCGKGGRNPNNIRKALNRQFPGEYRVLITVFVERIRDKKYTLLDHIRQGERFDSMSFTKNGKIFTVFNVIVDWDMKYVRDNNIPTTAERYTEKLGNAEITVTMPHVCCNPAPVIRIKLVPPVVEPQPPKKGRIIVKKEAIDFQNNSITPVPQFTFILDGGADKEKNDATGEAVFEVDPGFHQIDEPKVEGWKELPGMPADGRVEVKAGQTVVVLKKNRQVLPPRKEAPPPVQEAPPVVVPEPTPTPEVTPQGPPEEPPLAPPQKIEELKVENELNGGGGGYYSRVAEGFFLYGNTVPWWFRGDGAGSRYGLGVTTFFTRGKSDPFHSTWENYNIVPQIAWKGFFDRGREDYELGQIYLRFLGYDVEKAKIKATGDKLTQRNFPTFGGRLEYERGNLKSWRYGVFTEASFAPKREFHGTFDGSPAKTHIAGGGVWARYPLSQNWSVQLNLMSFYNWRDRSAPISIGPLFRWEKGLFFGPTFNIFSFRPDVYKKAGIPWKDLNSIGGFVQFEVHTLLWPIYRSSRQKSVVSTEPVPDELKAAVEAEKQVEVASTEPEPEVSNSGITRVAYQTESEEESARESDSDTSRPEESESTTVVPILFDQNAGSPEVANPDFHVSLK